MENIAVNQILKEKNRIQYIFTASEGLKGYFSGKEFYIEYPCDIETVPDSVAVIPFVCNVLPIIWLTDSQLLVSELDKDFYECLPNVKEGYRKIYPESIFAGTLEIGRIVNNKREESETSAVFFSGGVDSTYTLIRHLEEAPHLLSIWGSDVYYDNDQGWLIVEEALKKSADLFQLKQKTIRSTFRVFDNESVLNSDYCKTLQSGWWYGVKHGLGIIGHAAPYAWIYGLKNLYIAASNSLESKEDRCASDPRIDGQIRFCKCQVFHDGFEFNRQMKIQELVGFQRKTQNTRIPLHVCWVSQRGNNCSHCEKCFRTMIGLWLEGADPADFGFEYDVNVLDEIYWKIAIETQTIGRDSWASIKKRLIQKWDQIDDAEFRRKVGWIREFDFYHLDENQCRKDQKTRKKISKPLQHRIRARLAQFRFYQKLHEIKVRIKHGK